MKRRSWLVENGQHLSFFVAVIATLGSLYLSEILGFLPCELCWYQRIAMYPLAVILAVAAVRKDTKSALYVLPIAMIGWCISLYHYLVQKSPWLQGAGDSCSGGVSCGYDYLDWFGIITIPMLAFIAFTIIIALQWIVYRANR